MVNYINNKFIIIASTAKLIDCVPKDASFHINAKQKAEYKSVIFQISHSCHCTGKSYILINI